MWYLVGSTSFYMDCLSHRVTTTLLLVTLIVLMFPLPSTTSDSAEAFAIEYDKTQVLSEINECGNGQLPLSVLCQNLDSEVQGSENAMNIILLHTSINGQPTGSVPNV